MRWKAFDLSEFQDRHRRDVDDAWQELLEVPSLSVGYYRLPAGGVDHQTPHPEDEIYHVLAGKAVLAVDGEETPVRRGSVVYVAAGVDHRFHSIERELEVLVFFSSGPAQEGEAE